MAVTYGTPIVTSVGARWRSDTTIGLDTSYPAGGYLLNPIYLKLISIEQCNATANEGGFIFDWITSTGKLKVLAASGGALTVTGTNLPSAVTGTAAAQIWTAGAYTPAGTVASTFIGIAMGVHSHVLTRNTQTVAVTPGTGVSAALAGFPIGCIESVKATVNAVPDVTIQMLPDGSTPVSGTATINPATGVMQFLIADTVTSATATYITATTTAVSAGTPEGTVTSTFTGTPAALTGSNAASALTATAAAQVWSGTVAGAASFAEVAPGTNLSALNALQIIAIGL